MRCAARPTDRGMRLARPRAPLHSASAFDSAILLLAIAGQTRPSDELISLECGSLRLTQLAARGAAPSPRYAHAATLLRREDGFVTRSAAALLAPSAGRYTDQHDLHVLDLGSLS